MSNPPRLLTTPEPVREYLHKRGEPIPQNVKLRRRSDGVVRMSAIKAAHEQYDEDEFPIEATQWYDPEQNAIVIPLPEPDGAEDDDQSGLDTFAVGSK